MGLLEFLLMLVVAAICGGIARSLVGYSRGGCLTSIALGFIGAMFGTWLAGQMGLPEILAINFGGRTFPVIWSIVGASLFVAALSLISRRRR